MFTTIKGFVNSLNQVPLKVCTFKIKNLCEVKQTLIENAV